MQGVLNFGLGTNLLVAVWNSPDSKLLSLGCQQVTVKAEIYVHCSRVEAVMRA